MGDYQPLDLSLWCNVGPQWVEQDGDLPLGARTLRGLPFQIGRTPAQPGSDSTAPEDANEPCFLGFGPGGYGEAVEITLNRNARWLIVVHRLLESRIREGDPVGRLIATYRMLYGDGQEIALPIRDRLEIAVVPTNWGHLPFLAVPDCFDDVPSRKSGPWESTGWRLTEIGQAYPRWFYLWAWPNPHPEKTLAALRIEPKDRPFLVAALTSSLLDEDPFGRQPRRPVKITLHDPEQAEQAFNLGVTVDRGAATYPYPLPAESAEAFLADGFRGWGQAYHNQNSPAYVEISALPSATIQVKSGETEVAALPWNDVLNQQVTENERVRLELVDRGKNWIHVTVVDDETGKPVPCRVHFRSPEGLPFQPHGHHDHLLSDMGTWHIDVGGDVRLGHMTYAYIDGRCQGWLPRGRVLVDVARGFEYEPLRTAVTIQPGQRELTLRLRRWTNQNAQRWFSGDSHVHFLSTQGAHLEAQGEDLNVVNLLQSQWGHLFTNTEDFVGRPVSSEDGRTVVYTSQENRQHMLGHLILLGLKEPVMPWCSDGPAEAEIGGTLETTLSHWADACHAQGGTVIIPHLPLPNGEPATLIATGRADAVEMLWHGMYNHIEYYRYLNGGYRLPLVGGTDKMTADVPVGLYRTYVYIPPDQPFSYDNWCQNLRLGRTFLSGGPILRFTVDGAMVGDTIQLSGNGGTVEVEAEAESILPIHTLEVVQAGEVVAATQEPAGTRHLHLKTRLSIDRHTWLAARVGGPDYAHPLSHHDGWGRGVMAHTSPIYVAVGEEWWMASEDTAQYMMTLVHGSIEYIRQRSRQHVPGTVTHHHGHADHLAYLEQPFHEALEAIQHKLCQLE